MAWYTFSEHFLLIWLHQFGKGILEGQNNRRWEGYYRSNSKVPLQHVSCGLWRRKPLFFPERVQRPRCCRLWRIFTPIKITETYWEHMFQCVSHKWIIKAYPYICSAIVTFFSGICGTQWWLCSDFSACCFKLSKLDEALTSVPGVPFVVILQIS